MKKRGDQSKSWSFIEASIDEIKRQAKGTKGPKDKDKKPDYTDNLIEAEPSNPLKRIP